MCGVLGFIGKLPRRDWTAAHQLMVELAVASEVRGVDAAGFAALTSSGDLLWRRQPGPARDLFGGADFSALRRRRVAIVIGHTRLATTGAPAVNGNNHPHFAGDLAGETWAWALVHNGFIPTHEEKAAALRLPLRSQCDSEILVQALHRWGETEGPETCLALGGKQSVLAMNTRTQRMLAWTNGEMPLVAFRVEGMSALWWASTEGIAQDALAAVGLRARFAEAKPGLVYRMEVNNGQVVIQKERTKATSSWRRA
jgi:glucosamine 6-phosphate synthetase-like amidotransferase/phosphosugar isomerase protein